MKHSKFLYYPNAKLVSDDIDKIVYKIFFSLFRIHIGIETSKYSKDSFDLVSE